MMIAKINLHCIQLRNRGLMNYCENAACYALILFQVFQ